MGACIPVRGVHAPFLCPCTVLFRLRFSSLRDTWRASDDSAGWINCQILRTYLGRKMCLMSGTNACLLPIFWGTVGWM